MSLKETAPLLIIALAASTTSASTFDIATATGLFTPSFRGQANTTWVGWDTFDDADPNPLDSFELIDDNTPDIGNVGVDGGRFWTTNGEDHRSGSGNYYSGGGTVAEDITFDTAGVNGSGYTTVIVQANTAFGGFFSDVLFSDIDGVSPVQTLQGPNAVGQDQLFAKYELPGTADPQTFSISVLNFGIGTHTSFDKFVVDTYWSPNGYAADAAINTPEPVTSMLALSSLLGVAAGWRRR